MKVILQQDVSNLGDAGDVVEVAGGYGRNYLIPRGLAVKATNANLRRLRERHRVHERREHEELERARRIAETLEGTSVRIGARAGESGRLYGSVTAANIARALERVIGEKVDKRKLDLDDPLRELGRHEVTLRLHAQVSATVTVDVEVEG